jgi:hypothetical protein
MARVEGATARQRMCWLQGSRGGCNTPWQLLALIPLQERICSRDPRGSRCRPQEGGGTFVGWGRGGAGRGRAEQARS